MNLKIPQKYSILLSSLIVLSSIPKTVRSAFVAGSSSSFTTSTSATTTTSASSSLKMTNKIIDSHLHIWATSEESKTKYPYASQKQIPPPSLIDKASPTQLLKQMEEANVDGTLIVQPINHQYDHEYVLHAIQTYPTKFKGMLLFDPTSMTTLNDDDHDDGGDLAVSRLEELVLAGFVGVRFNPYLWPESNSSSGSSNDNGDGDGNGSKYMSKGSGMKVYKRCGELKVPVGIMCFKGLELHYDDIIDLLTQSPDTTLILDHFGFTFLNNNNDNNDNDNDNDNDNKSKKQMELLLSLAKYPNVIIKISALFRIAAANNNNNDTTTIDDPYPYDKVKKERFDILLQTFGKDRLMFGTDFPFVLNEEGGYKGTVDLVNSWTQKEGVDVQDAIMYKNAERLFGVWGGVVKG